MITAIRAKSDAPSSGLTDRGVVKWFSQKKGFGFIESESGEEIFVHYSSIKGRGYRVLEPGDRVTYEKVPGPKGEQAFHVEVLS
ncbi:MAG: cold shock domain-containing protein [Calditrichaeota bacterium]|nr:cold shock domain-containing protein [Calditrichota bacterium]MCB9391092.1 cold shock domain-containing protein [Calditrichota bacterium]